MARHCWQAMVMMGAMLAGNALAQQAPPAEGVDEATASARAADGVKTLDEVRAIKPDDEPLDLYRFKSPVEPAPNRFSKSWSEPPTVEQVSLSGGYIFLGINYGLMAAAKGLHKLTNGRDQIQSAIARPPPALSEEQLRRAASHCEAEACAD